MPEVNWPDIPAYEPIVLSRAQQAAWRANHPETVVGDPACRWELQPKFVDLWEGDGI